jgi:PAS domain S-box-containing protein
MLWRAGPDGLCDWLNQTWLDFTGRTIEEELGRGWTEGLHPDDREACLSVYNAAFERRELIRVGFRLRRHDGIYRSVALDGRPYREAGGAFRGYSGSCVDISARNEAVAYLAGGPGKDDDARNESERNFQILVNGVTDYAIYLLDPAGNVTSWNTGAERVKGYPAEEAIGRHYGMFYTEEERREGVPNTSLERAIALGKFESEGWRVRKDGTRFWANTTINPIYAADGTLQGFAKITRDVTERREAQAQLEQAREQIFQSQKMEAVGQLTGGIAHDFNNLLTVILGNLDIIQRRMAREAIDPATIRRLVNNAIEGARRATVLTQRLLAFSRRQPLDPKPLDPNRFIAGAVDFIQRSLGETIEVRAVGGGGVWQIEADPNQLETALLNLALNARDAMSSGGKLTIETSNVYLDEAYARANPEVAPGDYVLLAVSDTGTGMDEATLARAFEPFFTTKPAGQGTGLGLSQVYGFVKQSGGHIKIYSEPGQGTTVGIYMPRLSGNAATAPRPQADVPRAGSGGEVILVVEDDAGVRSYITEVLVELGYQVLQAADGRAGLAALERSAAQVALLLTDVILPDFNGRDLAERARRRWPKLKVLFMTGYSRNAIVHQGRLDPGVALIQKPITQAALADRIRDVLDKS